MPDEQIAHGNPGEDLNALVAASKATQTHWPPAPNPAQPYIDTVRQYVSGGVPEVLRQHNIHYPGEGAVNWLGNVLNNPDVNTALSFSPALGVLKLTPRFNLPGGTRGYQLRNDVGDNVGHLTASWEPHRRNIYVADVSSTLPSPYPHGSIPAQANYASGSLGFSDLRSLVEALKQEFPRAETISGLRASGSRYGPAGTARGTEGAPTSIRIRRSVE